MSTRHFLTLMDLTPKELGYLIQRAVELKTMLHTGQFHEPLRGKTLGMIFEKSSTRTRVSFEVAMTQFGGASVFLSPRDTQLGRGEPVEDSARVLSRMVDVVMIRTFDHATVETFAGYSRVPVINALTDQFHPCQLLADMQTYVEHRGAIEGKKVAWIGDGNNMCASYINAAEQFGFELVVSCPEGFEPPPELVAEFAHRVTLEPDPAKAVAGAHLVSTDVWASMGQEEEQAERARRFADYQVSPALMDHADPEALFMHCLPAHRGEEISHDMLDDPRSVVWDQAENRLHAQKALLEFLVAGQG
ncbi:ornithine carbamoyltransferase [Alloalcanivorax profundimaris]|jgi:ornithine carbamoyltransferase|uniref:Ornithine carbamoyltransferase n=1 Tax=Alloalcanivorax profundimaris TaxID=2735259 RepID=A0ABS0AR05_9GAMM|nr:ornithine carbamoyltransferase [Alloalcanivorax profundimaris]MBU58138.1 ornithine carbamoyltransferase [Alcanivorax sp.]MCQ6261861.1 ornithine carbamoyltransferase [Alcanivorax sp. MM125-6]UWN48714.1 Ornithine carbamoyltransferase 1, phaseolotoxin-sensitive [Alcanivorax sp. ALC70]MBF1800955.1 ornithine carbamoyltransferase [Alloalcanivorax profundimaris]MBF5056430.1 ornithine carbamoyltransferase [Alloalcanivorax profundimaris]